MGGRTILCGGIRLSNAAFKKAQETPLMEMTFMASDDPDEIDVVMKGVKAKDLFSPGRDDEYREWAKNDYDAGAKLWVFGVSLHDDELPNANTDGLFKSLSKLKDKPGTDFVVAVTEGHLSQAWRIDQGGGAEIDYEDLPKIPSALSSLIFKARYDEAVGKVSALLTKGS
jgi:hypothetical protein